MGKYASKTAVTEDKSRLEIERTLNRYGADQFTYARDDQLGKAVIQFRANERFIRFRLDLPQRNTHRSSAAWEQASRTIWRTMLLCIKAKLEAVESGITEFEDEFMANIVLPDGKTASEFLRPQIDQAYLSGEMPKSLLALPAPEGY